MSDDDGPTSLLPDEVYWRDHYQWLLDQGYELRPRYHPEWKASWIKKQPYFRAEDSLFSLRASINYATRLSDGTQVVLKRLTKPDDELELAIMTSLCQGTAASDPKNHCVPLLDTLTPLDDKDTTLVVMPLLRPFNSPQFSTIGEALDFIRQLFKAIAYLHEQHIAYRDVSPQNIMMEGTGLFTQKWHPWRPKMNLDFTRQVRQSYTRTERPPKYYLIDFGLTRRYDESNTSPRETSHEGTFVKGIPEWEPSPPQPYDPFPLDIYCLGCLLKTHFTEGDPQIGATGYRGFDFLKPLVESMQQADPLKRPNISEVQAELETLIRRVPWKVARSPLVEQGESARLTSIFAVERFMNDVAHWSTQLRNTLQLRRAIPTRR